MDSWTHWVSDVMILWSVKSSTSICLGGVFLSSDGLFGLYHMSQGARNRGVKCFSTHMINEICVSEIQNLCEDCVDNVAAAHQLSR